MKRIVITGMGAITPVGHNVQTTWDAIKAGRSGIAPLTGIETSRIETRIGGQVHDFDPVATFGAKEARRMDRFCQLGVAAAQDALIDANYTVTEENTFDTGVLVSSAFGGAQTLEEGLQVFWSQGLKRVKPTTFPLTLSNMAPAMIAMRLGIRGINYCITAACATSALSIGEGAAIIQRGDAEVMIVGGTESLSAEFPIAGLNVMRATSTRNHDPQGASRPFDANRDGFVPSESAAVLVLESLEHAQARGARIHAELVGYGASADASHVSAPESSGIAIAHAIKLALRKARIGIHDIDYINAHGTSTQINDRQETRVIKQVFGEHAYEIPVSSTKSMIGHAMSSSGAVEAIISIKAIHDGVLPPTINYEHPDPECDLDYVPNTAREKQLVHVMSNSFGFGGQNGVLIFKRYDPDNIATAQ